VWCGRCEADGVGGGGGVALARAAPGPTVGRHTHTGPALSCTHCPAPPGALGYADLGIKAMKVSEREREGQRDTDTGPASISRQQQQQQQQPWAAAAVTDGGALAICITHPTPPCHGVSCVPVCSCIIKSKVTEGLPIEAVRYQRTGGYAYGDTKVCWWWGL
jgi:hypothetical protein